MPESTLFPIDPPDLNPEPAPDEPPPPSAKPPRRPRRASAKPDNRTELEEIRGELTKARSLLDELLHPPKSP